MSVMLGFAVRQMLLDSVGVADIVGDKIYPDVVTQGVPSYPYISYNTQITGVQYAKGPEGIQPTVDSCQVEVSGVTKSWDTGVRLLAAIRKAVEAKCVGYEDGYDFEADPMEVVSAVCAYNEDLDAYVATMVLETTTQEVTQDVTEEE